MNKTRLILKQIINTIPVIRDYYDFKASSILPCRFSDYMKFRLGLSKIYWPKEKSCLVSNPRSIYVGINSKIGRPGCYINGAGTVHIGNYVRIGPNVGIASANHDLYNRDLYVKKPIIIDDYCWIGMNSFITAGVVLGPFTVVGAGSVVTHSFPQGRCVVAGNPAKVIKVLDDTKCIPWHYNVEYYGFIKKDKFEKLKKKYLDI